METLSRSRGDERAPPVRDDPAESGPHGRFSVWLNGTRIHHNVELAEPTVRGFTELPEEWQGRGPLRLQADAAPVRYANIWASE